MEIIRSVDARKIAGKTLSDELSKIKSPTLLLLSGGSAFDVLSDVSPDSLGDHVTVGMLDERFDTSPRVNNFLQLKQTEFFKTAELKGCDFFDTSIIEKETFPSFSSRFERRIRLWLGMYTHGRVLVTMGIGTDGHTAGIFPYPGKKNMFEVFFEQEDDIAIGYDVGLKNEHPLRVTVTNYFLKQYVDRAIVYLSGESKRVILEQLHTHAGNTCDVPACVIHKMKKATIVTNLLQ